MDPEVLIAGAGPTGLVLGLWLARLGVRVRIIDKNAALSTTSRALAVQARTLEFYRQLGFGDDVVAAGLELAKVNLRAKGKRAAHVEFGRLGAVHGTAYAVIRTTATGSGTRARKTPTATLWGDACDIDAATACGESGPLFASDAFHLDAVPQYAGATADLTFASGLHRIEVRVVRAGRP